MNQSYRPSLEFEELLDAMCDDELTADRSRRLEEIVIGDDDALLHYLCQVHLHGTLHWNIAQPAWGEGVSNDRTDRCPPMPASFFPPIVIDLTTPGDSIQPFVAGPVFSYLVAAVVLVAMILGASLYKIAWPGQIADNPSNGSNSGKVVELAFVGRITDTEECRWADERSAAIVGSYVPMGRKYALASGLLEITYTNGTRVVLEGPCEFTADSSAGGYLCIGKLTARVEKAKPQATRSSPLFTLRTPMVTVTDLGTEFGVEVDDGGNCTTHVFKGRVEVKPHDSRHTDRAVELSVGESARIEIGSCQSVVVHRGVAEPERFSHVMPYRGSIQVFNTGIGIKHGTPDTHWGIVAAVNHPNFVPQAAVVTAVSTRYFRRNMPLQSQWISTGDMLPILPEDTTYTFRTTFEIGGRPSRTLALRGGFAADNHVEAIRINGESVPVPEHDYSSPFQELHPFFITGGFVEGTNVLEFDVRNGDPKIKQRPSRMLFLVELEVFTNRRNDLGHEPQRLHEGGKEDAR